MKIALIIYLTLNIISTYCGMISGATTYLPNDCRDNNKNRLEIILPGFYIGCWLMERPGDKK